MPRNRSILPADELAFLANALPKIHAAILARYDGKIVEKDQGAAHLSEIQARALLNAYRRIKRGRPS